MKKIVLLLPGLVLPAKAFAHAMSSADQQAALAGGPDMTHLRGLR